MERNDILSAAVEQGMIDSFLESAAGQTADTARMFLQATSWKLEKALELFYGGNNNHTLPSFETAPFMTAHCPGEWENYTESENIIENDGTRTPYREWENENINENDGSEVHEPLLVSRDSLHDMPYREWDNDTGYEYTSENDGSVTDDDWSGFHESESVENWNADELATSTFYNSSGYDRYSYMYHGLFEKKEDARNQDKWLIVNLQSSSNTLDRDTWANEAVSQIITSNFVFWQIYDDVDEGKKIKTFYKLDYVPATLVIDPITGQKMRLFSGMIDPESLLEDLVQYMEGSPKDFLCRKPQWKNSPFLPPEIQDETNQEDEVTRLAHDLKDLVKIEPSYPPLPEEPTGDKSTLCRIGVRLPNGQRLLRNFLRSDPIQLLWSFCYANIEDADERPLRLTNGIPGAFKDLDYESKLTFDESDLSNSMISVTFTQV